MVYRGVRGGVEDRWHKKLRQPDGTVTEEPSAKYGALAWFHARYAEGTQEI